jgi:hypothetical protein
VIRQRTITRRIAGVLVIGSLAMLPACRSDDRPSDAAWQAVWEREQTVMPDADAIIAGGEDLCGALVGQLRLTAPALLPSPTEALDDAVRAWIGHAEGIAFDCPDDRAELDARFDALAVLAAEVDAGLSTDESS